MAAGRADQSAMPDISTKGRETFGTHGGLLVWAVRHEAARRPLLGGPPRASLSCRRGRALGEGHRSRARLPSRMGRIAELIPSPLQEHDALEAGRLYDVPVSRRLWGQWLVGGPLDDQPVPSTAVMVGPGRLEVPACGRVLIHRYAARPRLQPVPPKRIRSRRTSPASAAVQWFPNALRGLARGAAWPLAVLPQRPSRPGRLNAAAQMLPVVDWGTRFPGVRS
jgi:hypothetical protein